MLLLVTPDRFGECSDLIYQMHQLRYQIFKGRLGWDVETSGDVEIDEFDALRPTYLIHIDGGGRVGGCVRLLPTTGPTMLSRVFPTLLGGKPAPSVPRIWESSRFCLAPGNKSSAVRSGVSQGFCELCSGMIEFGLSRNLSDIVTVTDLRVERLARSAGWPLRRIGQPQQLGETRSVAGFLEISRQALSNVRQTGTIHGPTLWEPVPLPEVA